MALDEAAVMATSFMQWRFGAKESGDVLPRSSWSEGGGRKYNLKNSNVRKFLQWEDQTWGINIGWTDDAGVETAERVTRWFVARQDEADDPIRYGAGVALGYGTEPSFLNYQYQDVGINLHWSKTPSYEWKLFGGKLNSPVTTRDWFAIWNEKSEDGEPLLYFDRSAGGDIGWPTSKTWSRQVNEAARRAAKKAALEYLKSQAGGS